jgi:hypothetical protein
MSGENETSQAPSPAPAPAAPAAPAVDEFRVINLEPAPAPAASTETPTPPASTNTSDAVTSDKESAKGDAVGVSDGPEAVADKARKVSAQDRIDELTRARRSAEREAEYWRGRANEVPAARANVAPVREAFANESDFVKEMSAWTVQQAKAVATTAAAEQMAQNTALTAWNAKVESARTTIPDYDAVMSKAELPVSNNVASIIRGNSQGPVIAYELAKQPELLEKLNAMGVADAAIEIGQLLGKQKPVAPAPAPAPTPPQRTTKAPDPLTEKVSAGNTVPATDPSGMSMEEYTAYRQKQGAWWAR